MSVCLSLVGRAEMAGWMVGGRRLLFNLLYVMCIHILQSTYDAVSALGFDGSKCMTGKRFA